MATLLDQQVLQALHPAEFMHTLPFPWHEFERLLTSEGFATLREEFPETEKFEAHQGIRRAHDQRPHDRLYLAYERSIYHRKRSSGRGVIQDSDLSLTWRQLMKELASPAYLEAVQKLFDVDEMQVRYAWHIGGETSEVSPHVDGPAKLGTHIFYFNSPDEWDESWGGETLLLGEKGNDRQNPEFADFADIQPISCIDNRSLLFQNKETSWHGVRSLTCPPGAQRRLFNVVFERTSLR